MSLNMRLKRKPLRPVLAILSLVALVAVVAWGAFGSPTSANVLGYLAGPPAAAPGSQAQGKEAIPNNDGFDALPAGMKGLAYSTLVNKGLVHPSTDLGFRPPAVQPSHPSSVPSLNITWGAIQNVSGNPGGGFGANEPAASMHPTNPLLALAGGNTYAPSPVHANIENTLDLGTTWTRRASPNCSTDGDGVPHWLPSNINGGNSAINVSLCASASGADLSMSRSTDLGVTFTNCPTCGINTSGFFNDREYEFSDRNPSSPFFGHTYVTVALFDPAGSGSFNTVGLRGTSDGGDTWSP